MPRHAAYTLAWWWDGGFVDVSFDFVSCAHEHMCVWTVQEIRGMKSLKGPGESMS